MSRMQKLIGLLIVASVLAMESSSGAQAPAVTASSQPRLMRLDGAPIKGSPTARVVLIEVSDFECPFCGRYARETMPQIEWAYVQTGRIRYAFLNMPVEVNHKNAFKAAEAAACAGDQGKFWEMHDRFFANQAAIAPIHLPIHAQILGLKADTFKACLDSSRHAAEIRRDFKMATDAGVTGTPAFFLGTADPGSSTVRVAESFVGNKPFPVLKAALDALLAQSAPAVRR